MPVAIALFKLLFGLSGRIDRATYWRAIVLYLGGLLVVAVIAALVGAVLTGHGHVDMAIPFLILLIPLSVRRLHDRDKSGWRLLAFFGLPAVLDYLPDAAGTGLQLAVALAELALLIWAFVELGCLRGAAGPNRFGPDPLAD
jgi:uncharacterized membrane protein YhaH (DUF805 family)